MKHLILSFIVLASANCFAQGSGPIAGEENGQPQVVYRSEISGKSCDDAKQSASTEAMAQCYSDANHSGTCTLSFVGEEKYEHTYSTHTCGVLCLTIGLRGSATHHTQRCNAIAVATKS